MLILPSSPFIYPQKNTLDFSKVLTSCLEVQFHLYHSFNKNALSLYKYSGLFTNIERE